MGAQLSAANGASTHSVPSQQPSHELATSDAAAAAVAAAAVAVADFSGSFQLPPAPSQSMYQYYPDSVAAFEPPVDAPEHQQGQLHSSPPTPTDAERSHPPQYTLHAPDNPVYAVMSSSPPLSGAVAAARASSAFTSLSMVDPITGSTLGGSQAAAAAAHASCANPVGCASLTDIKQGAHASAGGPAVAVVGAAQSGSTDLEPSSVEMHGAHIASSPSLNDVASNLFSLRQIAQPVAGSLEDRIGGETPAANGGLIAVAAAAASMDSQGEGDAHQPQQVDAHHLRRSMVQSPFSLGVVPDNIQFQNFS
ncbi:hypothetical protein IWQ57_000712 [Coemansia nantahalensis]|uniref:Uncharacterized protein n=1 Tax=Coemansia nantahalensis TaxID=2789366 RepID=A0ACC1K6X2_9FUNG|nr:hypothetical protein IWQ57_000712 [Coemansia nantahalensis]